MFQTTIITDRRRLYGESIKTHIHTHSHIHTLAIIFSCHNNSFLINDAELFKLVAFNLALFDPAVFDVDLF